MARDMSTSSRPALLLALVLLLASSAGCASTSRAIGSVGRAAAANPALLLAGVGVAALTVGVAQDSFKHDPKAAEDAARRYPRVLYAVEQGPAWYPPP